MEGVNLLLLIIIFGGIPGLFLIVGAIVLIYRRYRKYGGSTVTRAENCGELRVPSLDSLVIGEDVLGFGIDGLVISGSLEGAPVAIKFRKPPNDVDGPASGSIGRSSGPIGATPMSIWSADTVEDTFSASVIRDAEALKSISHPNVIKFMGVSQMVDGRVAFLFELMPKGSLKTLLSSSSSPLSLEDRVRLITEIANGMQYLHSLGFIHGNLRPSNILLTDSLQAKVADFCCGPTTEVLVTNRSEPTEKVIWYSPELLSGARPSKASDVYAFGIIAWALLTRDDPYKGLPLALVASNVREGGMSLDLDGLCGEAQWLLLSCWSYQPSSRPSFETLTSSMIPIAAKSILSE